MPTLLTPAKATREAKRALQAHHLAGVVGRVHSRWTDDHRTSVLTLVHMTTDAYAELVTAALEKELAEVLEVYGVDPSNDPRFYAVAVVRKAEGAS